MKYAYLYYPREYTDSVDSKYIRVDSKYIRVDSKYIRVDSKNVLGDNKDVRVDSKDTLTEINACEVSVEILHMK
jgi:hypothetical protein